MTAVEWFAKQVLRSRQLGFISNEKFNELLEQAKEMEKEQSLKVPSYDLDELFNEVDESIDYHEFDFTSFRLGFQKAIELLTFKSE